MTHVKELDAVWSPRLHTYSQFHRLALATWDVDPVYSVLVELARESRFTIDQAAWLGLLHVAFYDLGSALLAYALTGGAPILDERMLSLPCGTERRGHRDPVQLHAHLSAVAARCQAWGSASVWLRQLATGPSGEPVYEHLAAGLAQVHGYGRWATYKACELLSHLLRSYDPAWAGIEPSDMGHAHSTGPRQGLALLTDTPRGNTPHDISRLDQLSAWLVEHLRGLGLPATAATAETTLCDFHALVEGRYYIGHDIDQMAAQIRRADDRVVDVLGDNMDTLGVGCNLIEATWDARAAALPRAYLGEHDDPRRYAVDVERRKTFRDTGRLLERP